MELFMLSNKKLRFDVLQLVLGDPIYKKIHKRLVVPVLMLITASDFSLLGQNFWKFSISVPFNYFVIWISEWISFTNILFFLFLCLESF